VASLGYYDSYGIADAEYALYKQADENGLAERKTYKILQVRCHLGTGVVSKLEIEGE
jgi:hypothetical protein